MENIDFVKHNTGRREHFALSTVIASEGDHKYVKKVSVSKPSEAFIRTIAENHLLLKETYTSVNVCNCVLNDTGKELVFDFIDGKNFSTVLIEYVDAGDEEGLLEALLLFKSIVLDFDRLEIMQSSNITPGFIEVFGQYDGILPFAHVKVSNIDINFKNLIKGKNNNYTMIDYEWVYDFPIPLNYIIFRSVRAFFLHYCPAANRLCFLNDVLQTVLGIMPEEIEVFHKMEMNFASFVGNESNINTIQSASDDLLYFASKHPTIYIYGTGFYASNVVSILKFDKIDYKGFIISDGMPSLGSYFSRPVHFLSEVDLERDGVGIILALNKTNQDEVIDLLPKHIMDRVFLFQ